MNTQHINFPGNNKETIAEAESMLQAISIDAQKEQEPEHFKELISLKSWLENKIENHKV
jgi:hypothetical protein